MKTICIKCGEPKKNHTCKCSECGFQPQNDVDISKSRILSEPWDFTRLDNGEVVSVGRTESELAEISSSIKAGNPYRFPEDELEGMLHVFKEFNATSDKDILKATFLWLMPVLGAVVLMICMFILS